MTDNNLIPVYGNIMKCFLNLIGYLNLILKYETYKDDYKEYNYIFQTILNWTMLYETERNLNFISNEILIDIYEKADNLQSKYICNNNLSSESEFSDYVLNLIWDLRIFYKKYIDEESK